MTNLLKNTLCLQHHYKELTDCLGTLKIYLAKLEEPLSELDENYYRNKQQFEIERYEKLASQVIELTTEHPIVHSDKFDFFYAS